MPALNIKIFVGDSKDDGVQRAQAGELIKCTDPAIDQGYWMSASDLKSIYTLIQECKQWPAAVQMEDQFKAMSRNPDAWTKMKKEIGQ